MSGKNVKIYRGALEKEGLSEVAYYFKKAEQNIQYAAYALDNTRFSDALLKISDINRKLAEIRRLTEEVVSGIDAASLSIYEKLQDREESEEAKNHV